MLQAGYYHKVSGYDEDDSDEEDDADEGDEGSDGLPPQAVNEKWSK